MAVTLNIRAHKYSSLIFKIPALFLSNFIHKKTANKFKLQDSRGLQTRLFETMHPLGNSRTLAIILKMTFLLWPKFEMFHGFYLPRIFFSKCVCSSQKWEIFTPRRPLKHFSEVSCISYKDFLNEVYKLVQCILNMFPCRSRGRVQTTWINEGVAQMTTTLNNSYLVKVST